MLFVCSVIKLQKEAEITPKEVKEDKGFKVGKGQIPEQEKQAENIQLKPTPPIIKEPEVNINYSIPLVHFSPILSLIIRLKLNLH